MKVCIICSNFQELGIRLLPWRFIYEISKGLKSESVDVEIISDGYPILSKKSEIFGINIYRIKKLTAFNFLGYHRVITLLEKISPDVILVQIGPTSFHFLSVLKKINIPIIGLWMNTNYDLKQIINLGPNEIIRNFNYIRLYIFNILIPSFLIKYMIKLPNLKKIIVFNKNNREKMIKYDVTFDKKISIIPLGITNSDLEYPDYFEVNKLKKQLELDEKNFVVLYLGSPLTLRGTDVLIDAISLIHEDIPYLRLIILSRVYSDITKKQEAYIKQLIRKRKVDYLTKIFSNVFTRDEIKKFIAMTDVVALPFKLVPSDNPLSILEVMAQGKTVISTKVDGIPELLDNGKGYLINPNNPKTLASAITTLYSNRQMRQNYEKKSRSYMEKYPHWDQITHEILKLINDVC